MINFFSKIASVIFSVVTAIFSFGGQPAVPSPLISVAVIEERQVVSPTPTESLKVSEQKQPKLTASPSATPSISTPIPTTLPTPKPTPEVIYVYVTVTPTPIPSPTPTPSPTPKPDTTAPQITVFWATNREQGNNQMDHIQDTLYYPVKDEYGNIQSYCRMCVLVISNEHITGTVDYKEYGQSNLIYKGFVENGQMTSQIVNGYFYMADLPNGSNIWTYYKINAKDKSNNQYVGEWSNYNADYRIYIW